MSKMKTRRAAAKRFSFTGTGKIKRRKANSRHNMTAQAHKVTVGQRKPAIVAAADAPMIKKMMPYG